jgi:hypothetical protein
MRHMLVFVMMASALVILAAIAISIMISIGSGRTSWLLLGVFVVDSIALMLLAARLTFWRGDGRPRDGNAMPR